MSPDDVRHGTTRGYHAGCRDLCCRRAIAAYEKAGRLARLNGGRAIPAIGVQRRIQALMRLGWTSQDIALAAGYSHRNSIFRILKGQRGKPCVWLERATVDRIAQTYERLAMAPPESTMVRRRTVALAERNGWPLPVRWLDIDDPDERPDPGWTPRQFRAAELVEEWEFLRSWGATKETAAARLGIGIDAIEKAVIRARSEVA